jgi:hypothetical protein
MEQYSTFAHQQHKEEVEANGIILCMNQKGRDVSPNVDLMYPYIILSLNLSGTSHSLYDMKDIRANKNDLTVFLPDHIIRPLIIVRITSMRGCSLIPVNLRIRS